MTYPAKPNDFAKGAPEVKIPNQMDPKYRDIGARTKIVRRRTTIKSTNTTGPVKYYTFRAFMTKENQEVEPPKQPLETLQSYLNEAASEDLTELPQDVIDDIKRLMRRGVNPSKKDLEQYHASQGRALTGEEDEESLSQGLPKWKNALELIDTAYQNAHIPKPKLETRGWKQYLDLIPYGVKLLADKYGLSGPNATWRVTKPIVVEDETPQYGQLAQMLGPLEKKHGDRSAELEAPAGYEPSHIGNKRFFVRIPGAGQNELDAKNIDEVIEQLTNKMRRHGVKVRIEHRSPEGAVLTFWHNNVKKEKITIHEIGK